MELAGLGQRVANPLSIVGGGRRSGKRGAVFRLAGGAEMGGEISDVGAWRSLVARFVRYPIRGGSGVCKALRLRRF